MKKRRIRQRSSRKKYLIFFLFIAVLAVALAVFLNFSKKHIIINPIVISQNGRSESIEGDLISKNISYSSISKVDQFSYEIFLKDNGQVIISNEKSIPDQLDSLQLILNRLTIEGKRFKSLDFRYDKPVINY